VKLAEASRQYQAYLEAVRTRPEDEQLCDELERVRRAMVVAWLERLAA